jgi:flagellar basal-body rod protein FlgF
MTDPRILATQARAMRHLELRQESLSHTLANASTPGFRADRVFARMAPDASGPLTEQALDRSAGPVQATRRPLDLALEGPGFLVVSTPQGERLTRAGNLTVDAAGRLTNGQGHPVLGRRGTIVLPPGEVVVNPDGRVHVEGHPLDELRLEVPEEEAELLREGGQLFSLPPGVGTERSSETRVKQGFLEGSNAEPIQAMTEMLEIQRSFASLQRSVHVLDGVLDRVANDLGRVR